MRIQRYLLFDTITSIRVGSKYNGIKISQIAAQAVNSTTTQLFTFNGTSHVTMHVKRGVHVSYLANHKNRDTTNELMQKRCFHIFCLLLPMLSLIFCVMCDV